LTTIRRERESKLIGGAAVLQLSRVVERQP
jgi:hypothetical protein